MDDNKLAHAIKVVKSLLEMNPNPLSEGQKRELEVVLADLRDARYEKVAGWG